jgi:hypothetical protein
MNLLRQFEQDLRKFYGISVDGGDGLTCGWTEDCSNGRGCDPTVVSKASAPAEGACWFDDEQPHRLRWSDIIEPDPGCGGGLKGIGCEIKKRLFTKSCAGAGLSGLGVLAASSTGPGGIILSAIIFPTNFGSPRQRGTPWE